MKYIILGLGNFGASLAEKLTEMGNEVIGVDISMSKVEMLKDKISHVVAPGASAGMNTGEGFDSPEQNVA